MRGKEGSRRVKGFASRDWRVVKKVSSQAIGTARKRLRLRRLARREKGFVSGDGHGVEKALPQAIRTLRRRGNLSWIFRVDLIFFCVPDES